MTILQHPQRCASAKALLTLVLACTVLIVNCSPSSNSSNTNTNTQAVLSSSPPFSTKEPERYRATRTISFNEASATNSVNKTRTSNVVIVRDGANRREEYEAGALGTIVYVETVAGRFVMLPQAKLYATQGDETTDAGVTQLKVEPETMSPDFLLNESTVSTEYQKLGQEERSGRTTTKYRVITRSGNPSRTNETLIWVDEALGMPIASQSATSDSNGSTRITMELHDISTEVEPGAFALPADYRKVALTQILSMVRASGEAGQSPAAK